MGRERLPDHDPHPDPVPPNLCQGAAGPMTKAVWAQTARGGSPRCLRPGLRVISRGAGGAAIHLHAARAEQLCQRASSHASGWGA